MRVREPVSFWRENDITVVISSRVFVRKRSGENKSSKRRISCLFGTAKGFKFNCMNCVKAGERVLDK